MDKYPSPNKPHRKVSKNLNLCTKCNKVWELAYQYRKTLYYLEFPTIGLERKDCERCASIGK
jgi:hypothetical protein